MKIAYKDWRPQGKSRVMVAQANVIAAEYRAQGYDLTLRQLYYQFVARGLLANKQSEYKRLGAVINDARLGGLFDWDLMVDRTRNVAGGDVDYGDPDTFMESMADVYRLALWEGQDTQLEVWVEKEALAGVVARAANTWSIPYFSCRGYVSQSELWGAARRLERKLRRHPERGGSQARDIVILHLGDHDPSGLDMTRDITERLWMFLSGDGFDPYRVKVERIALNMDQIEQYDPPPNPAKETDSRFAAYIDQYGEESWELDALDPTTLNNLIERHIRETMGELGIEMYKQRVIDQEKVRISLRTVASHWTDIVPDYQDEIDEAIAAFEPEISEDEDE